MPFTLPRPEISIRWKLLGAFLIVLVGSIIVAFTSIVLHRDAADRASMLEAENVAQTIANGAQFEPLTNAGNLQQYVDRLGNLMERDIIIVDRQGQVVAGTERKWLGSSAARAEVTMTMLDGITRAFTDGFDPDAGMAKRVVVPLRDNPEEHGSPTVGAVIVQYTNLYDSLTKQVQRAGDITGIVALMLMVFGLAAALYVTSSIIKPLAILESAAANIANADYSVRVTIRNRDEIGRLANAFNAMAGDLGRSHAALLERAIEQERTNALVEAGLTHQEEAAKKIEALAYFDALTGLFNRLMFRTILSEAILKHQGEERRFGVLLLDTDRFKQINDTLGHETGDLLLQELSARIKGCMHSADTVARLGGDEFVILLPDLYRKADAESVAKKILAAISQPCAIDGHDLRVTASIGISLFPDDGIDEQTLMKRADIAMYQTKENGRNGFRFYDPARDMNTFERLAMESSLRRALERNELVLHYQPKRNFHSGTISGMEALLRWRHPDLGLVSPDQFIPVAEETGLIVPIGLWVLRTACLQTMSFHARGLSDLVVAVNLSARQFEDEGLLMAIIAILDETGMDASWLELEITESTIMQDVQKARALLVALKAMGVRIAIDDFGTGHSSLGSLRQFPIDTLKIDRTFVRDVTTSKDDEELAKAIITLGRTLKLHLVAEGVETREQARFLHEQGCDEMQGYYFSKPIPADTFETFVRKHRASLVKQDSTFGAMPFSR